MKNVLIIGSGIAGLTCAIETAKKGHHVTLVSPYPSERAQSVMAAGGINAALNTLGENDSIEKHIEDTIKGGCFIADRKAVEELCTDAPAIIDWLESIGTVFNRNENGEVSLRAFGGQSCRRTAFSGASTGKQIVSSLIREARKYECRGMIQRRLNTHFHSAILKDDICHGALLYSETTRKIEPFYADAVVMATGGQNSLFGITTGSFLCDGYATGKLLRQGATLKNLEFIQYHPTTIATPQKKMLITEGARGEGGRLYYLNGDRRVYFMEDLYGEKGNLMPRDIVAKHIYSAPSQVYLDIAFLGEKLIRERLSEVEELCRHYAGIDVTKESIPVSPSVHFFMGGLAVDRKHETNLKHLYAIGECAAIYHGANRLGGNSLLAAIHSGRVAAESIHHSEAPLQHPDFSAYIHDQEQKMQKRLDTESKFSSVSIHFAFATVMNCDLGITRTEEKLKEGIDSIDFYLSVCDKLNYNSEVSAYPVYCLKSQLTLARAILTAAEARKETRGSHIREDYPETKEDFRCASLIRFHHDKFDISYQKEDE